MLPSSKHIARNVGIFGGAQAMSVLAALVRTKVAAVFIGSAGVGLSALFTSTTTFFSNLSGLGLSFSGVKFLSEIYAGGDREQLQKEVARLRGSGMLCALAGFIICLAAAPILSRIYFADTAHILPFASLSVFVATTILSGIELAILKACQKTRALALSLIWAAVVSVAISVPFYILKGIDGIIWAVVISGISESLLAFFFGHRTIPFHLPPISSKIFSQKIIVLGLAFLAGSVIASAADLVIQGFFSAVAIYTLGLYKAGYQLSITYTGMIFTAVGNDFYPRLSAVATDVDSRNRLLARQIRVLLLITIPLIVFFIFIVPYLLPFLFAETFSPICHMVQIASLSIILKSITMPLNFLPLAMGRPKDYLILESVFWLLLIPFVIGGYKIAGLTGTGLAILLCHIIELAYSYIFCHVRYQLRLFKI